MPPRKTTVIKTMQSLESQITSWAESQGDIRAILVIGSRARRDFPADEWSDIDLIVFATDFKRYLENDEWLNAFGGHWLSLAYETGGGDPERIVRFDGYRKADFVFLTVDSLCSMVESGTLDGLYHRGYYILVDKDGLAAKLPPPPFKPPPREKPQEHTFVLSVSWFWHGAVYVAQQIHRRNLWVVKYRDWTMKEILLRMLEWHAQAKHGWSYDTWHNGHFLSKWVDPEAWNDLQKAFGRFDAADSWQALLTTMDLFRRLAMETASRMNYTYPVTIDERFTQLVERIYEEDVHRS